MKPRSTLLRHTAREGDSNALGVPLYSRNLSGAAYGTAGVVLQNAIFGVLSVLPRACWITFLVLMLVWITHTQGGFKWTKTAMGSQGLLNLHFIFMTVAWPICMFEAIFSYRMPIYKLPHRNAYKYLHVALQTAAGIFILLGIIFVGLFKHYSHEDQFFSVHSWLGAIAIAMYIAQYTAGFWAYLVSRWAPERKAAFYSVHRFLGSATLLTALTAILIALEEVQTFDLFAKYGIKAFFNSSKPYSLVSVLLPIMALLILSQAVVIMYNLVHGQQVIPAGKAAPAQNGVHAKAGPGDNGVSGSV